MAKIRQKWEKMKKKKLKVLSVENDKNVQFGIFGGQKI